MRRPRGGQSILEPCTIGPVVQRVVLAFERLQPRGVSGVSRNDRSTRYRFVQIMQPVALRLRAGRMIGGRDLRDLGFGPGKWVAHHLGPFAQRAIEWRIVVIPDGEDRKSTRLNSSH